MHTHVHVLLTTKNQLPH